MEFIFVLAVILFEVFLIHLFQVVKVVGAFGIDALVDDKVFPVFFGNESISTVRTAQFYRGEAAFIRGESCITDLTQELSLGPIVFVQKGFWGITAGAGAGVRNITFRPAADRADLFAIAFFVVGDEILVSPVLTEVSDQREFINFELLVLWGMGIIKSPLLEGDISADEVDQPAVLLVKILNYRE